MKRFMLLIRTDPAAFRRLDDTAREERMRRMRRIVGELQGKGLLVSASKLEDAGGRVVTKRGTEERPFGRGDEVVGGFFVVRAEDEDQAETIARLMPQVEAGGSIEVRPIEPAGERGAEA